MNDPILCDHFPCMLMVLNGCFVVTFRNFSSRFYFQFFLSFSSLSCLNLTPSKLLLRISLVSIGLTCTPYVLSYLTVKSVAFRKDDEYIQSDSLYLRN
jgi:hypothetical protein